MMMKTKTVVFSETPFFKSIYNRLHKENRNWLCAISGDTGSGKSYIALRFGEILDIAFNIDNLVFTPKEFLNLVKYGKRNNGGEYVPLPPGSIIIFDEAGVGMSSRQWFTVQNQLIGYLLQTFRFKNYGVIFTVPSLSFIDVQARKLFHNYLRTQGIDYKSKVAIASIYMLDHNDWIDKTYRHTVKDDPSTSTAFWSFSKPCEELIEAYEAKKQQYAEDLYAMALATLDEIEGKRVPKGMRAELMLREGKDPLKIADDLQMKVSTIMKYKRDLKEAGATLTGDIFGEDI